LGNSFLDGGVAFLAGAAAAALAFGSSFTGAGGLGFGSYLTGSSGKSSIGAPVKNVVSSGSSGGYLTAGTGAFGGSGVASFGGGSGVASLGGSGVASF